MDDVPVFAAVIYASIRLGYSYYKIRWRAMSSFKGVDGNCISVDVCV